MKKFSLALLALATVLAIAPVAKADPITQISGTIDINTSNDHWNSTGVFFTSSISPFGAQDETKNLTIIANGSPVTIGTSSLLFGSAPPNTPETFTFTSGGNTGVFTITNVWATSNTADYITLQGIGWLTLTGFLPTQATFTAAGSDSSHNYGGEGSSAINFNVLAQPTPEPGTMTLFGTGLLGLAALVRRRFMPSR